MSEDANACKQWLNEVNWDMIHEDAVTMFLEWGNNNYHSAMRAPVTTSGSYAIYFAVDTWEEYKVVLMRMDNYGSTILCTKKLPPALAQELREEIGGIKGILELTPAVRAWLEKELDK